MRWFLLFVAFIAPQVALAEIADDDVRLELVLEDREHPPHVGEMILLSIRGTYKVPVVRENLRQSTLAGFDWMQLGEDRWFKAREDGFEVLKFERRMALFPQEDGPLTIDPFTHDLELLSGNQTIAFQKVSDTVTLTTVPQPQSEVWWFPVRKLEVSDQWSNQPEMLDPGAAALRVVSLTIEGTAPQRIPPMPVLTGAGAFIFPHPEHRIVALGPNGPVTRVFWRWTIRPKKGSAGYLNPVDLTYFDAEARQAETIKLAAQRVAYAGGPQNVVAQDNQTISAAPSDQSNAPSRTNLPTWVIWLAVAFGFFAGVGLILWHWGRAVLAVPRWLRADPDRKALRKAVKSGDTKATWIAARRVLKGRAWPKSLRQLDAALFSDRDMPDLKRVSIDVMESIR